MGESKSRQPRVGTPAWVCGQIRKSSKYRAWRKQVLSQTKLCQSCFQKISGSHAHHKTPLSVLVDLHNIKDLYDAERCDELWDVNNGQVLCPVCHDLETYRAARLHGWKKVTLNVLTITKKGGRKKRQARKTKSHRRLLAKSGKRRSEREGEIDAQMAATAERDRSDL